MVLFQAKKDQNDLQIDKHAPAPTHEAAPGLSSEAERSLALKPLSASPTTENQSR
jgi:hypothetical protein